MTEAKHIIPSKSEAGQSAQRVWQPFENLRQEIERLFEEFGGPSWTSAVRRSLVRNGALTTAVDIVEKKDRYELSAELPGLDEKDVEVKLTGDGLTIRGQKIEEREEKDQDFHLSERHFGSFERYFTLPESVDTKKIDASFKNGVLTVVLPKNPESQKADRRIPIKAAA